MWGWGLNDTGQLAMPVSTTVPAPARIPIGLNPQFLAAGGFHSLAIDGNGRLITWGSGFAGQLGDGHTADSDTPLVAALPGPVTSVSAGRYHTLARVSGGNVWGFGDNSNCQISVAPLGDPPIRPVDLGSPGALAVQAGEYHSLVLGADHRVLAWGDDSGGELGRGDVLWSHYDCEQSSIGNGSATVLAGGNAATVIALEGDVMLPDASPD